MTENNSNKELSDRDRLQVEWLVASGISEELAREIVKNQRRGRLGGWR